MHPLSSNVFDKKIYDFLIGSDAARFLNFGEEDGRYAKIIKTAKPHSFIDSIHNFIDITVGLTLNWTDRKYDVVVLGDVINNLKKSEGLDAINFFMYRSKWIIVTFSYGVSDDNYQSVWGFQDFMNLPVRFEEEGYMKMAIIKGFV